MEPSKIFGTGNEECHSSESGWTMYIGSPIQGGDDDDDDGRSTEADHDANYGGADSGGRRHAVDETDANCEAAADSDHDSMASDASSGPSHQGLQQTQFCRNIEGTGHHGHGMSTTQYFKHEEEDDDEEEGDYYLNKIKAEKSVEKQKLIGMKEKEQMTFKAKGTSSSTTPSRSGSKVRKSIWLGKRK